MFVLHAEQVLYLSLVVHGSNEFVTYENAHNYNWINYESD